jgi:trk system potassium uptake protein
MKIIILGCGRVGIYLAQTLDKAGHQVTVVDRNPDSFSKLGGEYGGQMVLGTGIDEDVLKKAGIEKADAFIAVTNGDNTNAMAAQIAKHVFNVQHVVARMYDPIREDTYRLLGLETVCSTVMGAERIREMVGA